MAKRTSLRVGQGLGKPPKPIVESATTGPEQMVADFLKKVSSWCPHGPSATQEVFLKLGCREAMFGGQAGGGKSDALLMAALQGVMHPHYSAILFRRTHRDLSLPGALMDRCAAWLQGSGCRWDNENKIWKVPESGARLAFGYLDERRDHLRYQSTEFQFIGFDEATQFEPNQYLYMFSRLRRNADFTRDFPLRFRGATNPGGIGHQFIKDRFNIPLEGTKTVIRTPVNYRNGRTGERIFVPSSAADNPGLDLEDYNMSLAELAETTRRQLQEGKWCMDTSGLVYSGIAEIRKVQQLPDERNWEFTLAADYGVDDAFAVAVLACCPYRPEVYVVQTTEPGMKTPQDCAEYIHRLNIQYGFTQMVGDSGGLGKGYIEEARKHWCLPINPIQKTDKRGYIELLNGAMSTGMLVVVEPGCRTFLEQAQQLEWKDGRHLDELDCQPNHSTDAVLYGWRACRHYRAENRPDPRAYEPDEIEAAEMAEAETSEDDRMWDRLIA